MAKEEYLTVGELADKAGVTVRAIQYYDQEGLLRPSARGPQNQRLYTEENVKELYRILSLKYLKLSLAEIKEEAALFADAEDLRKLVGQQMDEVETSIQHIFKRFSTLRTLMDKAMEEKGSAIHWSDIAGIIEDCQDENQFFWRLTCIREDELDSSQDGDIVIRQEMISLWHELIADTISLITEREPIDSPRNLDLARRYLRLDESQQTLSIDQNFILMENISPHGQPPHGHSSRGQVIDGQPPHGQDEGSFGSLRMTVVKHLEQAVEVYNARAHAGEPAP